MLEEEPCPEVLKRQCRMQSTINDLSRLAWSRERDFPYSETKIKTILITAAEFLQEIFDTTDLNATDEDKRSITKLIAKIDILVNNSLQKRFTYAPYNLSECILQTRNWLVKLFRTTTPLGKNYVAKEASALHEITPYLNLEEQKIIKTTPAITIILESFYYALGMRPRIGRRFTSLALQVLNPVQGEQALTIQSKQKRGRTLPEYKALDIQELFESICEMKGEVASPKEIIIELFKIDRYLTTKEKFTKRIKQLIQAKIIPLDILARLVKLNILPPNLHQIAKEQTSPPPLPAVIGQGAPASI